MKSFFTVFVSVFCLCVATKAASVEPLVAELQKDNSNKPLHSSEMPTNEDCIQPKETGRCFALFYRFAYDVEKGECVQFIYGGCNGNSNNFKTKRDCELNCLQNKQNPPANDEDADDDDEEGGNLSTTVSPNTATEATTEQVN